MGMQFSTGLWPVHPNGGDDRVECKLRKGVLTVLLADGATGIGYGSEAADTAMDHVMTALAASGPGLLSVQVLVGILAGADRHVVDVLKGEGDTTFVAIQTDGLRLVGASCGDSEAILIRGDGSRLDLTLSQNRKPRMGSGARPIGFEVASVDGTLVVGSDGLFPNLPRDEFEKIARQSPSSSAVVAGLEASVASRCDNDGAIRLPDDLAIAVVRF